MDGTIKSPIPPSLDMGSDEVLIKTEHRHGFSTERPS